MYATEKTAASRRILAQPHASYGSLEKCPVRQSTNTCQWSPDHCSARKRKIKADNQSPQQTLYHWRKLSDKFHLLKKNHPTISRWLQAGSWKLGGLLVVVGLAISYLHLRNEKDAYMEPQWKWDHNVYNPRLNVASNVSRPALETRDAPFSTRGRNHDNLLLAQFSGGPLLVDDMTAISSRPNRAYARQWVRDYVSYASASPLERACFDKVVFLNTILARQTRPPWAPSAHVQYDVVVLLPPDAIITDLDYDILRLFPPDKLVGVASYADSNNVRNDSMFSEILFFNLRHRYAVETAELWFSLTEPPVTCGAGNDIELLLDAMEVLVDDPEEREALVARLVVSERGFLPDRAVKVIPPKVPSSKAVALVTNALETKAELQTTADSVCYRYYPRCDVL